MIWDSKRTNFWFFSLVCLFLLPWSPAEKKWKKTNIPRIKLEQGSGAKLSKWRLLLFSVSAKYTCSLKPFPTFSNGFICSSNIRCSVSRKRLLVQIFYSSLVSWPNRSYHKLSRVIFEKLFFEVECICFRIKRKPIWKMVIVIIEKSLTNKYYVERSL